MVVEHYLTDFQKGKSASKCKQLLDCMNIESRTGKDPPTEHRLRQMRYLEEEYQRHTIK
jgi:hypothetical protein